jgi:hypothetical protein
VLPTLYVPDGNSTVPPPAALAALTALVMDAASLVLPLPVAP